MRISLFSSLTDTGENVQKWTRVFSTRRWVNLVARMRRKKRRKILDSTFGRFCLWTSFESSSVSVNLRIPEIWITQRTNLKATSVRYKKHLADIFWVWAYLIKSFGNRLEKSTLEDARKVAAFEKILKKSRLTLFTV